jgi:CheY-like chemotaxis protein
MQSPRYADFIAIYLSRVVFGMKLPQGWLYRGLAFSLLFLSGMRNTPKKILIVDSNAAFRESLRTFIKGLGHEVFEGATGPEAIDKASSNQPDLIIMDVRLPGLNGDEVTARLKANQATRKIPVVINTGWTTACNVEERINRALNAGAAEIMYKPLQFPVLRGVLRSYLMA